jgi:hypothetical protein
MSKGFSPTDSSFLARGQLTTSIHLPCYCRVHIYVVIHFDGNLFITVLSFICMYCRWRISYQKRRVGIPLNGLTLPHLSACPNPGTWFSIVICRGLLVFSEFISDESDCLFCWNCLSSLFRGDCLFCWYWWNYWPSLLRDDCSLCWYWCELLTITV